jgi:hypothetical protein
VGLHKAAVPWGPVDAAECPEAQACPVAEQEALTLMIAIDQSFDGFLEPGNTRFCRFAPRASGHQEPTGAGALDGEQLGNPRK